MAELGQQITSAHLTCSICQRCYTNPKALPCQHSFCEGCLRDYIFSRHYEGLGHFPCPVCQEEIQIPNKGIDGLPNNEYLNRLMTTVRTSGAADQGDASNLTPFTKETTAVPQDQSQGDMGSEVMPSAPDRVPTPLYPDLSTLDTDPPDYDSLQHGPQQTVPVRYACDNALVCFGQYGQGLTEFTTPIGLCVSGKHGVPLIHVTDQRGNRVLSFSLSGELKSIFSCKGEIYDVDCDKRDILYVANAKANRALALTYNLQGRGTGSYGNHFTFVKPHGIVVNKLGEVVVSTLENMCFVLGQDGKTLQEFGRKTKGKEGFLTPYYMAVNSKNDIIVSDRDSNSIKLFDRTGKSKSSFGSYGCNKGELHHPLGVTCDIYDNIVVADAGNCRVQVFDSTGNYKYSVKTPVELGRRGTPTTGSDVIPRAVSVVHDKLVVLFTGEQFGEVRIYNYHTTRQNSKTCQVQ